MQIFKLIFENFTKIYLKKKIKPFTLVGALRIEYTEY